MSNLFYAEKFKTILKDLGYNILLTFGTYSETGLEFDRKGLRKLHINFQQLDKIEYIERLARGHNKSNFYLCVFLHELAHVKQRVKNKYYESLYFEIKNELIADRYAKMNYNYFQQKYFDTALTKQKVNVIL